MVCGSPFWRLPLAGWKNSLWIGLGCAVVVLVVSLARASVESGSLAGPAARVKERLTFAWGLIEEKSCDKRYRGLFLLLIIALPWTLDRYSTDVLVITGIYTMLALGLNVVVGFAGLLDLGYVAFYAVGAYSYALLNSWYGLSFWPALGVGVACSAVFGVILGIPVLRLRGDYLAIVTLGFGEIIRLVLNNWDNVTQGPNGILGIGRPYLGEMRLYKPMHFYYLVVVLCIVTIFIVNRLDKSRLGRAWAAMREDETVAECMGINIVYTKLSAFAFGAAWAGFGGVVFAAKQTFISPESFTFFESVIILCMVVLGGMASIPGVMLGAFILTVLPEVLRELTLFRPMLLGSAMVLMMVLRPQGLLQAKSRRYLLERDEPRSEAGAGK